jgi:lysine-specific demethylase 8
MHGPLLLQMGQHYLEESWGTQLVTLGEFIRAHVIDSVTTDAVATHADGPCSGVVDSGHAALTGGCASAAVRAALAPGATEGRGARARRRRGYLAQHELFDQIPALATDIRTPDYCALGEDGLRSVNAWFGPAGTVTPLHQDPYHNLLAQVRRRRWQRLGLHGAGGTAGRRVRCGQPSWLQWRRLARQG